MVQTSRYSQNTAQGSSMIPSALILPVRNGRQQKPRTVTEQGGETEQEGGGFELRPWGC